MDRRNQSTVFWTSLLAAGAGALVAGSYLARRARRYDLAGKVCLVTGGSRGLGLLLARRLVRQGARVAICARDEAEINRARDELKAVEPNVLAVQCDITRPEQVAGLVEGIHAHFGPVDVLINNAGIIQVGPIEHMTEADYQEAMAVHFWGPYYLTRAVLPDMKLRGGGRIVNISSIGGKVPAPHLAPYAASKFALTGFSHALRTELLKDNIYVTTVSPGLMRTGSPRQVWAKGQARKEYAWFKIGDSLPGLSMSAERAADKIIDALVHGDADLTLTLLARIGVKFHHLFTNTSLALAAMANRLLPSPGGIGAQRVRGAEAESPASQGPLTQLTDEAARRNNEM